MAMRMVLGLEVIQSYKRLSYTPWHAIAELVDNSTQSFFDHRDVLDKEYAKNDDILDVSIVYDKDQELLRISDNAMGMSYDELERAMHVGERPPNTNGRCQYGMGLKTAACWIGNSWTVRTKKLGDTTEYQVSIDVDTISTGKSELPFKRRDNLPKSQHYTIVEITRHNRAFHGRTLGKIRDFLRSMYRQDLRNQTLRLSWNATELTWDDSEEPFLKARDGSPFRKDFEFKVDGKSVKGWVGVLEKGGRAKAGFSILHADRVVRGWPDSWRPESLFGQIQGSNDLVNQRLVGELHMNDFEVSHTKDDILWQGDEEEEVQSGLKKQCSDYVEVAKTYRHRTDDQRAPSELETKIAVDELKRELTSAEMADLVTLEDVPPPEVVRKSILSLEQAVANREPTFSATMGSFNISGYLVNDVSVNDPYLIVESTTPDNVMVIVNMLHPHWAQLEGSVGVLNYLRHCAYDGIAEWQARHKAASLDPDTIKLLKDRLLRLPLSMEMHIGQSEDATE